MQIAEEAPFLFFEDIIPFSVDPDAVPTLTDTDTVSVLATDAWVLQQDLDSSVADRLIWNSGRNWSGRTISMEDADGRWHDFRIREVWTTPSAPPVYGRSYMTLEKPWPTAVLPTGMKYRIQTSEMALPDDTIEIRSMTLKRNQLDYPLSVIGQDRAEYASLNMADRLQSQGVPRWCFRREYQVLQAPTFDPVSTSTHLLPFWTGPEPRGKFQYLFTYVWGQREIWYTTPGPLEQTQPQPITTPDTTSSRVEAYWESGPSEVTTATEVLTYVSQQITTYHGIDITLPNIDFMLGFDDDNNAAPFMPRYHKSGIKKRIYRRRLTDAGDRVAAGVRVESPDNYFFLDEVDGHVINYTDDGTITPDYNRPFREIHGYQTLRFTPVPDKTYAVEMRCVRTPRKLVDDKDVPRIHSDAIPTLINRTLQYVYEAMGNESCKRSAQADYERALYNLTKRYGDARPSSRVRKKRVASVHRNLIYRRQFPLVKG